MDHVWWDNYVARARANRDVTFLEPHEMTLNELNKTVDKFSTSVKHHAEFMENFQAKVDAAQKELNKRRLTLEKVK